MFPHSVAHPYTDRIIIYVTGTVSGPEVMKNFFFMLNSAEHKIFSANKYENANYCWHFHIYYQRNFHAQLGLAKKNWQLLVI